jgi:hypothetical protein
MAWLTGGRKEVINILDTITQTTIQACLGSWSTTLRLVLLILAIGLATRATRPRRRRR